MDIDKPNYHDFRTAIFMTMDFCGSTRDIAESYQADTGIDDNTRDSWHLNALIDYKAASDKIKRTIQGG